MSRPEDIPQDVWDDAVLHFELATSMFPVCQMPHLLDTGVAFIARAILAAKAEEREACATLAFAFNEDVPEHFSAMPFSLDAAAGWASARIAAAIRKRGEA